MRRPRSVDLTDGDYSFLKPYYDRVLDLQNAGAQVDYGTVTTNKLTYQAEFGKQQAAMMPMGIVVRRDPARAAEVR